MKDPELSAELPVRVLGAEGLVTTCNSFVVCLCPEQQSNASVVAWDNNKQHVSYTSYIIESIFWGDGAMPPVERLFELKRSLLDQC